MLPGQLILQHKYYIHQVQLFQNMLHLNFERQYYLLHHSLSNLSQSLLDEKYFLQSIYYNHLQRHFHLKCYYNHYQLKEALRCYSSRIDKIHQIAPMKGTLNQKTLRDLGCLHNNSYLRKNHKF